MNCMKCGREIKGTNVFCPECAAEMEKYPVKPGTLVQLPPKTYSAPVKKKTIHRKKVLKPEEHVARLRHSVRWLIIALLVVILAFSIVTGMLLRMLDDRDSTEEIGRNYQTLSETVDN